MQNEDNNKPYQITIETFTGEIQTGVKVFTVSERDFYRALKIAQTDPHNNKTMTEDYITHVKQSRQLYLYPDEYQRFIGKQVDDQIKILFNI